METPSQSPVAPVASPLLLVDETGRTRHLTGADIPSLVDFLRNGGALNFHVGDAQEEEEAKTRTE